MWGGSFICEVWPFLINYSQTWKKSHICIKPVAGPLRLNSGKPWKNLRKTNIILSLLHNEKNYYKLANVTNNPGKILNTHKLTDDDASKKHLIIMAALKKIKEKLDAMDAKTGITIDWNIHNNNNNNKANG